MGFLHSDLGQLCGHRLSHTALNLTEWLSEGKCFLAGMSYVYRHSNYVRVLLACNLVKTPSYLYGHSLSIMRFC